MDANKTAIKAALGRYLQHWHGRMFADTPALREYATRSFDKAAMWAPGRMVDQVEEMLEAYRKNDAAQADQPKPKLPIVLVAMAKDFMPAPPEYGRGMGDEQDVIIPSDDRERLFRMSVVVVDLRVQIAIAAPEEGTAHSIALQLHRHTSTVSNRLFYADIPVAGIPQKWPVQIELPDLNGMNVATDVKNLTILLLDLTLRATVPMLRAPAAGEENDGRGGANATDPWAPGYDPHGFPVVVEAQGKQTPSLNPAATPISYWSVGGRP